MKPQAWGPRDGIITFIRRDARGPPPLSFCPLSDSHLFPCSIPGHSKKVAIWQAGRELSPELDCAGNLILDFHFQNCEKINVCCLSYPVCGTCYGGLSSLRQ